MKDGAKKNFLEGCHEIGIEIGEAEVDLVERYIDLLGKWSARMNLTSVKSEEDRMKRLVLESLVITPDLSGFRGRVMDLGSGAGVPGVPLKIVLPELDMMLCEPRAKRAAFLREVKRKLGLDGLEVFEGRAEDFLGKVDVVVSRAVASDDELCLRADNVLEVGGKIFSLGSDDEEKVGVEGFEMAEEREYELRAAGRRGKVRIWEKKGG